MFGSLEGPKYSVFRIFSLGHLLESDGVENIFEVSEEDERERQDARQGVGHRKSVQATSHKRPGERKREVRYNTNNRA